MSFMKTEVFHDIYYQVETNHGIWVVPGSVVGWSLPVTASALADYVEGDVNDNDEVIAPREGWVARLSAPGYLDCTDWTAHETEAEAREYLVEVYGED